MKVFTHTEVPPLVLTTAAGAGRRRRATRRRPRCWPVRRRTPPADIATVLRVLADRGLRRVLTEGGPSPHSTFIDAGLLDESCAA